jgi:outer membrane protein
MRVLLLASVLSLALLAGPVYGQAAAQAPQQPAPAPPAAQAAQPPRPFPEGARIAFVDIQRVVNESAEGKKANARVVALIEKKRTDLVEREKTIQGNRDKLEKGAGVMSPQAQQQLQREIEQQEFSFRQAQQDAQDEVQQLQQELQLEFQKRLTPVMDAVAQARGLHMIFNRFEAGLVWADLGLDITADVLQRFDQTTGQKPTQD